MSACFIGNEVMFKRLKVSLTFEVLACGQILTNYLTSLIFNRGGDYDHISVGLF